LGNIGAEIVGRFGNARVLPCACAPWTLSRRSGSWNGARWPVIVESRPLTGPRNGRSACRWWATGRPTRC